MKFYKCDTCGKIIEVVKETNVPTVCCGQNMKEIVPGAVDAAVEKHVPAVQICCDEVKVCIGEAEHPMMDAHYIEWVLVETDKGSMKKNLKPGCTPKVCFCLGKNEKVIAVYAYCNLHGLWKKEM